MGLQVGQGWFLNTQVLYTKGCMYVCYGGEVQCHYTLKTYLRSKVGLGPLPLVAECVFLVFANCSFAPLAPKALCGWVEDGDAEAVYSCPILLDFCIMALSSLPEFMHFHKPLSQTQW